MLNKEDKKPSNTKREWDKPPSSDASLWWLSSPERFPREGGKQVWRQSQDLQRTKTLNQDERANTMRELWHKLWGKGGLPDERLNTCTGTATDAHRQGDGSQPTLRMNSVTPLSHSSMLSFSLLFCFRLLLNISSSYPAPSLSILGIAVEILAKSTQTVFREYGADFKQQFNFTDKQ